MKFWWLQMDSSSIPIAIGEPIGGGLFVSNVVLGAIVFAAGSGGSVAVEKRAFLRDAGFYCGATLLLILILYDQVVRPLPPLIPIRRIRQIHFAECLRIRWPLSMPLSSNPFPIHRRPVVIRGLRKLYCIN
jgi:hypothetical protein